VKTIKESSLERAIFFSETALCHSVREFVDHYRLERNHQGMGNRLITPINAVKSSGPVQRRGGLAACSITTIETPPSK